MIRYLRQTVFGLLFLIRKGKYSPSTINGDGAAPAPEPPVVDLGALMRERMLNARMRISDYRNKQAWVVAKRRLAEFLQLLPRAADCGFGRLAVLRWASHEITESGEIALKAEAALVYRWLQLAGLNPSVEMRTTRGELKNCVVLANWESSFPGTQANWSDLETLIASSDTTVLVVVPLVLAVDMTEQPKPIEVSVLPVCGALPADQADACVCESGPVANQALNDSAAAADAENAPNAPTLLASGGNVCSAPPVVPG